MKVKRRWLVPIMVAVLTLSAVTGCKGRQQDMPDTGAGEETASSETEAQGETGSIIVQVSSIEGPTISGEIGEVSIEAPEQAQDGTQSGEASEPPDMPDGETPGMDGSQQGAQSGSGSSQAPGNGQPPEGTPPSAPQQGTAGGGQAFDASGAQGSVPDLFTGSGEEITFTCTDKTQIYAQSPQGEEEADLDKIGEGSILELTLDGEGNALTIRIYMGGGQGLDAGGAGAPETQQSGQAGSGSAVETISQDQTLSGVSYLSSGDDENALRIDGGTVTLTDVTVEKTGGASSSTENGDFYGMNAAVLAASGASVTIQNATVSTNAVNGNGIFSYGTGTTVNILDSVIRTVQNNSGGIQTTGGGMTNATNLDVETAGASSAAIRSDRGGGTVNVTGGSYVTNGTGSPAVYSTAAISVTDAVLTANSSEAVVIEGKNSVSLTNCTLSGSMTGTYGGDGDENIHCVMIYQSMSGDAQVGQSSFSAAGGSITALAGDMFYVTNTSCVIHLDSVLFTPAGEVFLRIEGNSGARGWGQSGENGGSCILTAVDQAIRGNIIVDEISSLDMTLSGNSDFAGAVNPQGQAGQVDVTMEESALWTLTADSFVSSFDGTAANVNLNGFTLYVGAEAYTF